MLNGSAIDLLNLLSGYDLRRCDLPRRSMNALVWAKRAIRSSSYALRPAQIWELCSVLNGGASVDRSCRIIQVRLGRGCDRNSGDTLGSQWSQSYWNQSKSVAAGGECLFTKQLRKHSTGTYMELCCSICVSSEAVAEPMSEHDTDAELQRAHIKRTLTGLCLLRQVCLK